MSRPIGSKNSEKQPKVIEADEAERLEYLAALLLEIAEEELTAGEVTPCSLS